MGSFLIAFPETYLGEGDRAGKSPEYSPNSSALAQSNESYPFTNAELYTHSLQNFTGGFRPDNDGNTGTDDWGTFEVTSASLQISRSGDLYSNTSLTPNGSYNASYSFTEDNDGGLAAGLTYSIGDGYCAVTSYLGHQKVLATNRLNVNNVYAYVTYPSAQTSGTINLWFADTDVANGQGIVLTDTTGVGGADFQLASYSSTWRIYPGAATGWVNTGVACVSSRWYYHQITFNAATNNIVWQVDGVQIASFATDVAWAGGMTAFWFGTQNQIGKYVYIDAVDTSITPGWFANRSAVDLGGLGQYDGLPIFNQPLKYYEANSTLSPGAGIWSEGTTWARVPTSGRFNMLPLVPSAETGHKNILRCYSPDANDNFFFYGTGLSDASTGTFAAEVWARPMQSSAAIDAYFYFYGEDASGDNTIEFTNGQIRLGGSAIATYVAGLWVHVRCVMTLATHKISVFINGVLKAVNVAWGDPAGLLPNRVMLGVYGTGGEVFYDGLSFSIMPGYYAESNSYLQLNSTQSFTLEGNFAYKFQLRSSSESWESQTIPFEVSDNLKLISESPQESQWVLTDYSSGSWSNLYTSALDSYTLSASSGHYYWIEATNNATQDTRVSSSSPSINYGTGTWWYAAEFTTDHEYAFVDAASSLTAYLQNSNYTATYELYCFDRYNGGGDQTVYSVDAFNQGTLTWNSMTATQATPTLTLATITNGLDWLTYTTSQYSRYHEIRQAWGPQRSNRYYSTEYNSGDYCPHFVEREGKFYHSPTLFWAQTNMSETLAIRSPSFAAIGLQSRDRIRVTFNTTSAYSIDLLLKSGGVTQKTLSLVSSPNANFNTQTKEFLLSENINLDQLEISGTFEATKNIQITSIVIDRPSFESWEYTLGAYQTLDVSIPNLNLTLTVSQNSEVEYSENATLHQYVLNTLTYSPVITNERIVNLYDQSNTLLNFAWFRVNVSRWEEGVVLDTIMTSNTLRADDLTTFNMTVQDLFGNTLATRTNSPIQDVIEIYLTDLYSLKIQNNLRFNTTINLTLGSVSQYESLVSGEIAEYLLYAATYTIQYFQGETGQTITDSIVISAPAVYLLNSSYKAIYVSAYTLSGIGVSQEYTLWLNGSRIAWGGPHYVLSTTVNLTVLDYFGNIANSSIVVAQDASWYSLLLPIYSVKFENLMQAATLANFTLGGSVWSKPVMVGETQEFALLAGTYNLSYMQTETNTFVSTNLVVAGPLSYAANTSYFSVYFAAFSNDGLGMGNFARLYIDNLRKEFGFVKLLSSVHQVTVLDYFNDTIYDATVALQSYSEYNIFINTATLALTNNYTQPIYLNIEKNGVMLLKQEVGGKDSLIFRFTNGYYTITPYWLNGTVIVNQTKYVNLTAGSTELVTFGFLSEEIPVTFNTNFNDFLLIIYFFGVIAFVVLGLYTIRKRSQLGGNKPKKSSSSRGAHTKIG